MGPACHLSQFRLSPVSCTLSEDCWKQRLFRPLLSCFLVSLNVSGTWTGGGGRVAVYSRQSSVGASYFSTRESLTLGVC